MVACRRSRFAGSAGHAASFRAGRPALHRNCPASITSRRSLRARFRDHTGEGAIALHERHGRARRARRPRSADGRGGRRAPPHDARVGVCTDTAAPDSASEAWPLRSVSTRGDRRMDRAGREFVVIAASTPPARQSQKTKPSRSTTSPVAHAIGSVKIGPA
jgi:hypothetical protein